MWTDFIISLFPLFLLPLLIGTLLPSKNSTLAVRWLFGILSTSIYIIVTHAVGFSKIISLGGYSAILFLTLFRFLFLFKTNSNQFRFPKLNIPKLFLMIGVAFLLLESWLSIIANPISAWDAVTIWYRKTEAYYFWIPLRNFPIVNYPNLGPAYWSFILFFTDNKEAFGRFLFPITYFVFIIEIFNVFRDRTNQFLLSASLAFLAYYFFDESFTNGYQDGFLFSVSGIASLQLFKSNLFLNENAEEKYFQIQPLTALFFLGAIGLIKNEGIILSIIIFFSLLTLLHWKKIQKLSILIPFSFFYLSILFFWPLCLIISGIDASKLQGDAFNLNSLLQIFERLDRLSIILEYFKIYFLKRSLLLILSVATTIIFLRFNLSHYLEIVGLWLIFFVHSVFIIFAFMATNQDLKWHLDTAFFRLMFQHDFIFLILICLGMSQSSEKNEKPTSPNSLTPRRISSIHSLS